MSQGWLGFYKGNFIGLTHMTSQAIARAYLINPLYYMDNYLHTEFSFQSKLWAAFAVGTVIDLATHPLHVVQSRFVIQNRLPGFVIYKNLFHFLKAYLHRPSEFMLGWRGNIAINFVNTLTAGLLARDLTPKSIGLSLLAAQMICYPITTVMRRLECQSPKPGMIPVRYRNINHGLRLVLAEEGVRGLYGGITAYAMARLIQGLTTLAITTAKTRQKY